VALALPGNENPRAVEWSIRESDEEVEKSWTGSPKPETRNPIPDLNAIALASSAMWTAVAIVAARRMRDPRAAQSLGLVSQSIA
jgi:hypothetical protein